MIWRTSPLSVYTFCKVSICFHTAGLYQIRVHFAAELLHRGNTDSCSTSTSSRCQQDEVGAGAGRWVKLKIRNFPGLAFQPCVKHRIIRSFLSHFYPLAGSSCHLSRCGGVLSRYFVLWYPRSCVLLEKKDKREEVERKERFFSVRSSSTSVLFRVAVRVVASTKSRRKWLSCSYDRWSFLNNLIVVF